MDVGEFRSGANPPARDRSYGRARISPAYFTQFTIECSSPRLSTSPPHTGRRRLPFALCFVYSSMHLALGCQLA